MSHGLHFINDVVFWSFQEAISGKVCLIKSWEASSRAALGGFICHCLQSLQFLCLEIHPAIGRLTNHDPLAQAILSDTSSIDFQLGKSAVQI